ADLLVIQDPPARAPPARTLLPRERKRPAPHPEQQIRTLEGPTAGFLPWYQRAAARPLEMRRRLSVKFPRTIVATGLALTLIAPSTALASGPVDETTTTVEVSGEPSETIPDTPTLDTAGSDAGTTATLPPLDEGIEVDLGDVVLVEFGWFNAFARRSIGVTVKF